VRDAICQFIDRATPFKACCEAGQGVAAIEKAKQRPPALVILDLNIPMLHGVETASALRRMVPGTKIIGLAMFAAEFRRTLVAAGFDIILSKHEGLAKLAETINALLPAPAVVERNCSSTGATLGGRVSSVRILIVCRRRRKSGPLWQLSVDRCSGYALWYALESIEGLLGRMKNFSIFYAVCSPSLGPCAR
jgi:CheY-like chemotaxis protein